MVAKAAEQDEEQAAVSGKNVGGLVSKRLEMFEKPPPVTSKVASKSSIAVLRESRRGYRSRPQDSFDSPARAEIKEQVESRQSGSDAEEATYVGSTLIESGIHHYSNGEFEKALKAFNTALKTQRVSVGDDDICIALTLGNLGAVYIKQGDLNKAEERLLESLQMKRKLQPHMIVADTLNNLGNCCNLRGNYEQSLDYYREALEDLCTKHGRADDIANALFNIGRLQIQNHDWDGARNMLSEALRMSRELHGTNHVFVAQTLELIGLVQLSTSDFDAAMVSYTKALGTYRRLHGPLHHDVANALFHVGMVREAKGELADAWESYTTTRDLYSRLGTDSDYPGFKNVRLSISKVEKAIMKENQERIASKSKNARVSKEKKDSHRLPAGKQSPRAQNSPQSQEC